MKLPIVCCIAFANRVVLMLASSSRLTCQLAFWAVTLVCCTSYAQDCAAQADALLASKIDLRNWKLTLPVDANGRRIGKPREVMPVDLSGGFRNEFFSMDQKGNIIFSCPADGVTTEGTKYPRCELREMLDPADDSVNWQFTGTHILRARCRILNLTSEPKVVIGQIHGYSGTSRPLVKLQYAKDRLEALVKISPDSGKDRKLVFPKVSSEVEIQYEIKLHEAKLAVTVNGVTQTVDVLQDGPGWKDETFYFKAGVYPQTNRGDSNDETRVSFSELVVLHD